MATQVGVGYSENPDSAAAGHEAATAALEKASLQSCDMVLLFATSKHDPQLLHASVREVVGTKARIIGGYTVGVITADQLGYDGYQVGVAVLASDTAKLDLFIESGLPDNEFAVGQALGQAINSQSYEGEPSVLLMYDSVNRTSGRMKLNMATPLLEGMRQSFETWPQLAGAGLLGDMQCRPTFQWFDDRVEQQSAMALVVSGGARMDTVVMHGCKPAGGYHTVTKAEGQTVLEIDERPATEVVAELLGLKPEENWSDYRFFVTLGVNRGDKWGEFREEDYAIRLCSGRDKERRGLVMFEPNLTPGTEVQLMSRSVGFEYIGERAQRLLGQLEGRTPFFALYIDCAGRASAYCGTEEEEAAEVQRILGDQIPLLGIYSCAEIALVGGDIQPLGWSGVLCIFSE